MCMCTSGGRAEKERERIPRRLYAVNEVLQLRKSSLTMTYYPFYILLDLFTSILLRIFIPKL